MKAKILWTIALVLMLGFPAVSAVDYLVTATVKGITFDMGTSVVNCNCLQFSPSRPTWPGYYPEPGYFILDPATTNKKVSNPLLQLVVGEVYTFTTSAGVHELIFGGESDTLPDRRIGSHSATYENEYAEFWCRSDLACTTGTAFKQVKLKLSWTINV